MRYRTAKHRASGVFWGTFLSVLASPGIGAWAGDVMDSSLWDWSGSSTLRYDNYNVSGDKTSSPYPFVGPQVYNEVDLNFSRRFTSFNRVTGQISGLLFNDSDYRSTFHGVVPERLNIRQENGEGDIPYRLDVGDFFAFQSYRTVQRSLKGAQLELQPNLGGAARHSLVFFSGGRSSSWRDFHLQDDWFSGASWLVEHPHYGRLAANVVVNTRQANATAGQSAIQQSIYSLAFEKAGSWQGQHLTVEGELGQFFGDYPTTGGTTRNQQGGGWFLQATGSPQTQPALTYRLRLEAYEQAYRPSGGNIQPGRRSAEGHLSWRFANGVTARARAQTYRTGWQTANPTDTRVLGINLAGALGARWAPGLSGQVDAFEERARSRDRTTDSTTRSLNIHFGKAITRTLFARAGLLYTRLHDHAAAGESGTTQGTVGLDWRFDKAGYRGVVSPGLVIQDAKRLAGGHQRELQPTVNLSVGRGRHNLTASLSAQKQKGMAGTQNVLTRTAGLNYRYTQGPMVLGMEANWYERDPNNAARTGAWHLGAFLTWSFDKPARVGTGTQRMVTQPAAPAGDHTLMHTTKRFLIDLAAFKPGLAVDEARALAARAGLGKPVEQAGFLVWFDRILHQVLQPQRLAIEVHGGAVSRAALIIDLDDVGSGATLERTFAQVRRQVLEEYGQPDAFYEQGNFGPNLVADLGAGRFIRVMEWRRDGGVLRFGIPRRLDGQVRMELQFARRFPALRDAQWSVEVLQ